MVFFLQTKVIFEVLDNLLMDINKESFRLIQGGGGGSEHVLELIERYGLYLAELVPVEVITNETLNGDNLGIYTEYKNIIIIHHVQGFTNKCLHNHYR